jgi:FkbM family methyltransferase
VEQELKNISIADEILSLIHSLRSKYRTILLFRRTYHNYLNISIPLLRGKFPVKAILKTSNEPVSLNSYLQLIFLAKLEIARLQYCENVGYNFKEDTVTISMPDYDNKNRKTMVLLHGALSNGDVVGIFLDNIYHSLPVRDKIVVDVGANIGDSAIYFALSGAANVIAIEPFPRNYEMARKNIELNNLSNKIALLLAGCSSCNGSIVVNQSEYGHDRNLTDKSGHGVKLPLMTLENILDKNNVLRTDKAILKMDCEGCEYDIIFSSSRDTLRRFSHIQIEYHYGYKNLKEKLEKYGFSVSVTRPLINPWNRKYQVGYINAELNI